MALEEQCSRLRGLVHACLNDHLYTSAIFYADKLATLTNGAAADIYLLAETYFVSQQHRRALYLLRRDGMVERDLRFKHLAARCLAECKEWEECLNVLGDGTELEEEADSKEHNLGHSVSLQATICLLRARAFQAMDNRTRAVMWYRQALMHDAYCYEACAALIEGHLLTCEEEGELMEELRVHEDDRWLALLLRAKCKKYNVNHEMAEILGELEGPFNPLPASTHRHVRHGGNNAAGGAPPTTGLRIMRPMAKLHTPSTGNTDTLRGTGPYGIAQAQRTGLGGGDARHDASTQESPCPVYSGGPRHTPLHQTPSFAQHMGMAGMSTPVMPTMPSTASTPMNLTSTPLPASGISGRGIPTAVDLTPVSVDLTPASGVSMDQEVTPSTFGQHGGMLRMQHAAAAGRMHPGCVGGGAPGDVDMEADTPVSLAASSPMQLTQGAQHGGCDGLHGAADRPGTAQGQSAGLMTPSPCQAMGGEQAPGCGLGGNVDVLTCRADWLFHRGKYEACHRLMADVLEDDPYALQALPLALSSALIMGRRSELFMRGHKLVAEYPGHAVAWYAVGLYYMASRQYEAARRHLSRATSLDAGFAPAWVAFGHAFSAQDERDQAMAAYRTAARLFPGLHLPVLGMGMEYNAMNNLQLAERMLLAAHELCPGDAVTCHELGVCAYKSGNLVQAAAWLRNVLQLAAGLQEDGEPDMQGEEAGVPKGLNPTWEPTVLALGHCMRKQGALQEALDLYEHALALNPGQPGTLSAVGYTHQLRGALSEAIEAYHACLAIKPDDAFASEMLHLVLMDYSRTVD